MTTTRILGREAVRTLALTVGVDRLMDLMIVRIEALLARRASGELEIPARQGFVSQGDELGVIEWMPVLRRGHHAVIKHVGYHPTNAVNSGLPTIVSTLVAFDEGTGHLRVLCDGTFLTAVRTGAASAVASRLLAAPESRTLGLVGCGAQAVTQLHALSRVFQLEDVLYFDCDADVQASFAERASRVVPDSVRLRAATRTELARDSDIICTATSIAPHAGPVVDLTHARPWLHVNAVGSDLPGKTELPHAFLTKSLVVPDFAMQARHEGECQQLLPTEMGPELHEVVAAPERFAAWRRRSTVFDSTGFALEDLAALELVEALALEHGIGEDVALEAVGPDSHDPYAFLHTAPGVPSYSVMQRALASV